ncbi:helix-turn-helix domain-containing protein [Cellulosimicrobium cellulans]|uniref:helix-turn-helix domain-containing protein n=1 Tax=Cellulosimicrobium cellulans TaxID=1710 RepID=UPI003C546F13
MTDLFTASEFAKRIGMSEDWVRRNAKTLHHHRVGRLLRFSEDSVNDFKTRTAVAAADPLRRTERSRATRRK